MLDGFEQKELHHLDLLEDVGQAVWKNDNVIRITKGGDDFLNAIDKDKDT